MLFNRSEIDVLAIITSKDEQPRADAPRGRRRRNGCAWKICQAIPTNAGTVRVRIAQIGPHGFSIGARSQAGAAEEMEGAIENAGNSQHSLRARPRLKLPPSFVPTVQVQ